MVAVLQLDGAVVVGENHETLLAEWDSMILWRHLGVLALWLDGTIVQVHQRNIFGKAARTGGGSPAW